MYRQIFTPDFNLGFRSPRSDTCSRCEVLTDSDEVQRHKQNAEAAFIQQRIDRDEARKGNTMVITFDMEKTMPLPKLSVGRHFTCDKFGFITQVCMSSIETEKKCISKSGRRMKAREASTRCAHLC